MISLRMMDLARRISLKSEYDKYKIGAVIANKGTILGVGWNRAKTHPKSPHKYKHLHAEIDAAFRVPAWELDGATIYVYRAKKDGSMGLSRPCESCYKYLKSHYVKWMVYTSDEGIKMEKII